MAGAAAATATATAPPETALPAGDGPGYDDDDDYEEEECRICRLPAEAGRPLRRPCACRGSIRFVHDDCQLRWRAARQKNRCEVCNRNISTRPLYAADAPVRLHVSELMAGLPRKLMGLLLPLFFAVCVVWEFVIPLTTLWTWRLALATTFAQVHYLLSLRLSVTCIPASIALWATFLRWVAPFAVAPYVRWIERLVTWSERQEFQSFDAFQVLAILTVEVSLAVVIVDMALACIFCFVPFSLGRITLWSSCLNFDNVDEVNCYTSTASTLLIGFGLIFTVGASFAVVHTFHLYLRGKRLVTTIFYRRLYGIFFRGIIKLTRVANISLNILYNGIIYPLFFGCSLDICTSKMFGATMTQRFNFLIASSLASAALHWLIGRSFLKLRPRLFKLLHKIFGPGVFTPFLSYNFSEPFYKFYLKNFLGLFVDIMFVALVILVPIKIADLLAPEVFPLDITYFDHPAKGTSVWQGLLLNFAELFSAVHHMTYLIGKTVIYLGHVMERVVGYWSITAGQALGDNVPSKDQYDTCDDAKDEWRYAAVQTILRVVLAWLTAVIFYSGMLLFPVSVGRALLIAIPQLPVAGGLKSNDLFAVAVGFCIISTIIAALRDLSACMTSGRTCLLALKRDLLFFIWMVIIPLLIGLLADLLLISPFVGTDFPALNFFRTWLLGRFFKLLWINHVDESWEAKFKRANEDCSGELRAMWWFFQDVCIPVAMKLLVALAVPYVLAKGVFPRLGYSASLNSTVYRFSWLGSLGICAFYCLGKVLCVQLHDSIRDDRYAIGRTLEDVGDGS
ncbi:probable E3 ubiquitin ligase SUD1 isoform X2 [Hordeum vulgare subsp. vulgare]|uniref:probable E3 ubiquitin ligase SUD1 isoform X2 n=1 Tax=Hordeum vulgare subsp. vulgare TaxID=112509 RepID=UPI000B488C92|nr:probable E3 ubiquitin ligase SUD1 isoform X2 [Hordeum vulgare subsp. vulgare]